MEFDYTTFGTNVDEDGSVSETASTITVSSADTRQQNYYIQKDMGAAYFDGDFSFNVDVEITSDSTKSLAIVFMLSNAIGDLYDLDNADEDYLVCYFNRDSGDSKRLLLRERNGAATVQDEATYSLSTDYYLTITRDESIGTYGTLYCYIYSDSARETLVDTLTVTLTEKQDFQYICGFGGNNDEDATYDGAVSGTISNLRLLGPAISVSESISAAEVISKNLPLAGIDISDAISISELIDRWVTHYLILNKIPDPVTIVENILMDLQLAGFDVSDSVAISEGVTVLTSLEVDASDAIVISEYIKTLVGLQCWEEITITEHTNVRCTYEDYLLINSASVIPRYYFTLTGDGDSLDDVEMKIRSFQYRLRNARPTYLSIVLPYSDDYIDYINDRPNGDLVVDKAYILNGVEIAREEIIRVNYENVRPDLGPTNQSITLTGHKTETYAQNNITLENPIYDSTYEGTRTFRFAEPDLYLRPGDLLTVNGETIEVGLITSWVTADRSQMEVKEVE